MEPYTRNTQEQTRLRNVLRKRDFYFKAPRVTGYISFFRCVAIVLVSLDVRKQYQKPLSAECREACRKLDRYTDEVTLVCQEHLETPQDIQDYIARMNAEIDEVTAVRSKIRNKQRNCTDPVQMEELKKKCAACTTVLTDLRKKKKTACNVIEDNPKLRELLECEFEARLKTTRIFLRSGPFETVFLREKNMIMNADYSRKE